MKRVVPLVLVVGGVGVGLGVVAPGPRPPPALAPAPPESAPAEGLAAGTPVSGEEGTIVHTFATEDEMKTFATLWQQRQGSGVRLAVLKSFWDEENTELTKLNGALTETYQLDVTKNYMLDPNRRVIVERPAAAEPAPEAPPVQAPLLEQPAAP